MDKNVITLEHLVPIVNTEYELRIKQISNSFFSYATTQERIDFLLQQLDYSIQEIASAYLNHVFISKDIVNDVQRAGFDFVDNIKRFKGRLFGKLFDEYNEFITQQFFDVRSMLKQEFVQKFSPAFDYDDLDSKSVVVLYDYYGALRVDEHTLQSALESKRGYFGVKEIIEPRHHYFMFGFDRLSELSIISDAGMLLNTLLSHEIETVIRIEYFYQNLFSNPIKLEETAFKLQKHLDYYSSQLTLRYDDESMRLMHKKAKNLIH